MWTKGRGKLGVLKPLLGAWIAEAGGDMGPFTCRRAFAPTLDGKYVKLEVEWRFAGGRGYDELCLFGPDKELGVGFWSFTSDGKRSAGWISEAPDVHPAALAFEADMDAGRARQVYWPDPEDAEAVRWVVERRVKKGLSRFVEHVYRHEAR